MSKPKRLPKPTDAQRATVLATDHLFRLVHTIDFHIDNDEVALQQLRQELDDEYSNDEDYYTLYIEVVEFIIASLQRMHE